MEGVAGLQLCRPFVDLKSFQTSETLNFYSDATRNPLLGFRAFFNGKWLFGQWEPGYIEQHQPSIEYVELYALCFAIYMWDKLLKNCRIVTFCDNQAVVSMVNETSSKCKNCMVLIRLLVLNGLAHNRRVLVKYVRSRDNYLSDSLCRQKINLFQKLAPVGTENRPEHLPKTLWPASKLWIN